MGAGDLGAGHDHRLVPVLGVEGVDLAVGVPVGGVDAQVGTETQQLPAAVDGGDAHAGSRGQFGERPVRGARAEDGDVVDVLAVEVGAEGDALGEGGVAGDLLHPVHGEVDPVGEQEPVEFPFGGGTAVR